MPWTETAHREYLRDCLRYARPERPDDSADSVHRGSLPGRTQMWMRSISSSEISSGRRL